MTAPVDVLAVMTSTIRTLSIGGVPDEAQQMHKARAAVAELVAANKAVIAALSAPGAPTKTERDEMIACLSAALARTEEARS